MKWTDETTKSSWSTCRVLIRRMNGIDHANMMRLLRIKAIKLNQTKNPTKKPKLMQIKSRQIQSNQVLVFFFFFFLNGLVVPGRNLRRATTAVFRRPAMATACRRKNKKKGKGEEQTKKTQNRNEIPNNVRERKTFTFFWRGSQLKCMCVIKDFVYKKNFSTRHWVSFV